MIQPGGLAHRVSHDKGVSSGASEALDRAASPCDTVIRSGGEYEEAARGSPFGGLVASGWHTAALTMRLLVGGDLRVVGGLIGLGVEELSWPRPVRPGDVLRVESEVLGLRPSGSKPDRGIVRVRNTTLNGEGKPVMIQVVTMIVPRRPS